MKKIKISLAWQIVIALILGVLVGSFLHYSPEYREVLINNLLSPLVAIFINLTLYTTKFTEPLSYQDSAFLKLPKFP